MTSPVPAAATFHSWAIRLDGQLPVTLRTAKEVEAIARFCPPDQAVATRYAHSM